jgi:hypothetical protein
MRPRAVLADSLIIFLLAGGLVYKLFVIEYTRNWYSIESTFIADSRMLVEHLPHPGWQPLWYCGTRFDYLYPPALRYGPALISKATGVSTARGYHLYTAILYAFGITAVYWLVLAGARSPRMARQMAWLCAAGAALFSPAFALLPRYRHDSVFWVPQRLHVLTSYGEGPHISSLCLLGAALAASIMAFRSARLSWVALAGLACALVASTNFYGATGLAILFPLLLWSEWSGCRDSRLFLKATGIVALAWGFCASWLTPSYARVTVVNLHWVAQPGKNSSRLVAAVFLFLLALAIWRLGKGRPDRAWALFVFSAAATMSLYVVGYYYFGFQVTGDPLRLIPELDLVLILAMAQAGFWCWKKRSLRVFAVILAVLPLYPAADYLWHLKTPFSRARHVENQYEFLVTKWVHENLPGQRVLPSGSLRFWYDAWFDNPQPDGGSQQGLENEIIPVATWQITRGDNAGLATLWLQALGTDAVIVPDQTSLDQYQDYPTPEKFQGALLQLFDNGHGTRIYKVPRRFPGLARVVDASSVGSLVPIRGIDDFKNLKAYVDMIEAGPNSPATMKWNGPDSYDVDVSLDAGQSLLVQETFDPAWEARAEGKTLKTHPDAMGFTVVDVPPGHHRVEMRFVTPLENQVGYAALGLSSLVFVGLCFAPNGRAGRTSKH